MQTVIHHRKTARMGGNFSENPNLARPTGFEPAISSVTGRRDRPTSLRTHVTFHILANFSPLFK